MSKIDKNEIAEKLRAAIDAGRVAGNARVQELKQKAVENNGEPIREECGNAMPLIKLDGKSALARAIKNSDDTGVSISPMSSRAHRGYYAVSAHPKIEPDAQVDFQSCSIREHTADAIAKSLEAALGVKALVLTWRN